ncbi:DNA polymerase III, gamma subunit /DNA polymerase III, tau subunit [Ferrimonas sediminum]|uniref:DNA polymerase III subunit gamma/tau n=1 Tax=Ferrimonas sediminum TaxID=718193 RepID=A0A1G8P3A6_9GAMM|nr:DNA polymerase III subunit gamma/tau [Ferrimonas sediminum]SDI86983.1 DNA polymerase III, gamma subunit /DNA polymerase III, tau subunit [Ferrimonas sediminum]
MAYQVLARKWRPANFEQVVGQQHVLRALTNALEHDRLHHAYLFTGTRGVGKTSIARLFAKGLNCEQGITATPCGTCSACQEISQGRFVDLMEIDAASRTKVDDTREILDNVQYQPTRGRFKVYLIDEVHMLSRHSFNALLKTLEEPPPHVKFLLATTDPQKLPVTVLSRCLQFNLKSLSSDKIAAHLDTVLKAEGVEFEPQALNLLAQAADGSVRDAMSLTDQAIAHGNGGITLPEVQAMLGTLDSSYSLNLLHALVAGDLQGVMSTLAEIDQFAPDYDELLKQLLELLHNVAMTQFSVTASKLQPHSQALLQLATRLSREQVQLWYQMLAEGRRDLPLAPEPRSGLEMTLLRTLAFSPVTEIEPLVAELPVTPAARPEPRVPQSEPQPESRAPQPAPASAPQPAVAAPAPDRGVEVTAPSPQTPGSDDPQVLAAEQQMLMMQAQQLHGNLDYDEADAPMPAAQQMEEMQAQQALSTAPQEPVPVEAPQSPSPQIAPESASPMSLMERAMANRERLATRHQPAEDSQAKKPSPQAGAEPRSQRPIPPKPAVSQPQPQVAAPEPVAEPMPAASEPVADSTPPWDSDETPVAASQAQEVPTASPVAATPSAPEPTPTQPEAEPAVAAPAPVEAGFRAREDDEQWYQAIFDLGVMARARQLAINSLMDRQGDTIRLLLKPEQRHLMHESVVSQIRDKMVAVWQAPIELKIEVGEDRQRETPLEIRRRLHKERLAEAKVNLLDDPNVSWMMAELDAELIEESISYTQAENK